MFKTLLQAISHLFIPTWAEFRVQYISGARSEDERRFRQKMLARIEHRYPYF